VLPDFAGCQRPVAWSLLFRHVHSKIHRKIFQCLGMYVIHFSPLFYSKKLSLSQTIWRWMVDEMNRSGFGRWCGLIAEFVHINSRNHEKFRPYYVSAVIRNTYLPNTILAGFSLMKPTELDSSSIPHLVSFHEATPHHNNSTHSHPHR
jgi:hypothetical protein